MGFRRFKCFALLAPLLALLCDVPAKGQQNGHYLTAATGLMNGSLPPPGLYIGLVPFEYFVDSIRGPNGGSIPANITINAPIAVISAVTKTKCLGADYGFSVLVPIMNQRFSTNISPNRTFGGGYGVSDIFFTPLQLGWHRPKADFLFSYTMVAPTGDFSSDQVFNNGLGMWSNIFQLGTTYYLDKTKKWNALGSEYLGGRWHQESEWCQARFSNGSRIRFRPADPALCHEYRHRGKLLPQTDVR